MGMGRGSWGWVEYEDEGRSVQEMGQTRELIVVCWRHEGKIIQRIIILS